MADPQELALEHFEKIVLALAVGVVGFTLATSLGDPQEIRDTAKIDADRKGIEAHMRSAKPDEVELVDRVARLRDRLDEGRVGSAKELPAWMLHRRPGVLTKEKPPPETAKAKHYSVTNVKLDTSQRGKATVTWEKASDNDYVVVTEYVVQRRVGTDGEWAELVRLTNDKNSHTDSSLAARTEYYYRVVSLAEIDRMSKRVQRDKMTLPAEDAERISNEVGPAKTERDVYCIPQTVTVKDLVRNAKSKDAAYIYVYKFDTAAGNWMPKKGFQVTEGEEIGKKMKVGRTEVDYSTGATFVSCRTETGQGKFGQEIQVGVITIRWADGTEEEVRTTDPKPDEQGGGDKSE